MTSPETASRRRLAGKCACGAVHYSVADEFAYSQNCHCSNCRPWFTITDDLPQYDEHVVA